MKEKSKKKSGAQMMTSYLEKESSVFYLELATKYLKLLCDGLFSLNLWKSDLVKGLASFVFCVFLKC